MDIVELMSQIFVDFGWPGLITVLAIFVFVFILDKKLKQNDEHTAKTLNAGFDKMTNAITTQNEHLMTALIEQNSKNNEVFSKLVYSAVEKRDTDNIDSHNASIEARFEVSKIIQNKMHDLLNRYNADRTFILEFHNSKCNLSGLSFLWFDMVYEEVAKGRPSIVHTYKDQDISQIMSLIDEINKNNGYKILSAEDLQALQTKSTIMYQRLRIDRKLQEAILVGLYNERNTLLGILVLEYENSLIPVGVLDMEDIIAQSTAIATLLNYKPVLTAKN